MLGKEGLGEIDEIGNDLVVAVCPEGSKLKAVAGFLAVRPACRQAGPGKAPESVRPDDSVFPHC